MSHAYYGLAGVYVYIALVALFSFVIRRRNEEGS